MCRFLGAAEVETRLVSGQMANAAVFSALVDYLNRGNRKGEPRRMRMVMNNHIGKGGHLSAQPMGALKDFVAIDPRTDRPAVVNFPVLPEQPVPHRRGRAPSSSSTSTDRELIIFGKSMVLYREPVAEIRRFVDEQGLDTVIMYDMAHVLGLVGPYFQQPFAEGADIVTGSTHKTFFGTQRGVIGARFREHDERVRPVGDRAPPHLPRLGVQPPPGDHARAARRRLRDERLQRRLPAGGHRQRQGLRPRRSPTPACTWPATPPSTTPRPTRSSWRSATAGVRRSAERLEANNIICNYQAGPGRGGLHRRGRAAAGSRRDDPLRHGPG